MAKFYEIKLKGELDPCIDCAEGKSQQQNVKKETEGGSKTPGEHMFIHQSKMKAKSLGQPIGYLLLTIGCIDKAWKLFFETQRPPSGDTNNCVV